MKCRQGEVGAGPYNYKDCCGNLIQGYNGVDNNPLLPYVDFDQPHSNTIVDTEIPAVQMCPSKTPTPTPTITKTPTPTLTKSPTPTITKSPTRTPTPTKTRPKIVPIVRNPCVPQTIFPMGIICDVQNASSSTANDGYVGVIVTGGTPWYTYTWSNGSSEQYIYNISSGSYTVTVSDYYNDFVESITCKIDYSLDCNMDGNVELIPPTPSPTKTQTPTPTPTITPTKTLPEYEFKIYANELVSFTAQTLTNTANVTVYFGDGTTRLLPANQGGYIRFSKNYGSNPYTGWIIFRSTNLNAIKEFYISAPWVNGLPGKDKSLIVSTSELSKLTSLTVCDLGTTLGGQQQLTLPYLTGNTSQLPSTLTLLYSFYNDLTGSVNNLPHGLQYLRLADGQNLTGEVTSAQFSQLQILQYGLKIPLTINISNLPTTISVLDLFSRNMTVNGDISNLPPNLGYCHIINSGNTGTITGNINSLASTLYEFTINTGNLSGNLTTFFSTRSIIQRFMVYSTNTISGDLSTIINSSSTLKTFVLAKGNTLSGSIPNFTTFTNLESFLVYGELNTHCNLSGNISTITSLTNLKEFLISNSSTSNAITGNLTSLPLSLEVFSISGIDVDINLNLATSNIINNIKLKTLTISSTNYNTITGNLTYLPPNLIDLELRGTNLSLSYPITSGVKTWSPGMCSVTLIQGPGLGFNLNMTNAILNDLNTTSWTPCTLSVGGYNINIQATSGYTTPAYAQLVARGLLVTVHT